MWQSGKFVLLRAFNTSLQHYLIYYAPPLISNPHHAINIEEALVELQVVSWDYWCWLKSTSTRRSILDGKPITQKAPRLLRVIREEPERDLKFRKIMIESS